MEQQYYAELTQEAYDHAVKSSYIPKDLTPEQASALTAKLLRSALFGAAVRYGNHVRSKDKLAPLRQPRIPQNLGDWIDEKIRDLDTYSGNLGSRSFQTIANSMLSQLRSAESWFRNDDH